MLRQIPRKEFRMKKVFQNIEEILCSICLVVMTTLTFTNVIARYVFSASFSFSDEITTYLFVLLSLLGSAIAAKRYAHLGLTIILDVVNPMVRKILKLIGFALASVFSASICYYGIFMVISQYNKGQVTAGMQWPEWIFGSFVPIGSFFLTVRFIQVFIEEIKAQEPDKKEVF